MPAKGDDVAEKIEAQVREAVLKMVGDIRSSIDDIREAVVQQLQAAMQSVQADANAFSLKTQIQQVIDASGHSPAAAPAPAAPAAGKTTDVSSLKRSIQAVERGNSQIDVLNALLDQALNFGTRAALLILKGDSFAGWKGVGFSRHGGDDEAIKRFNAPVSSVPELDKLLRQEKVVAWNGASLASKMGVSPARSAVIVPMVIKDKISAALYVDHQEPARLNQGALELLVFTTGLLIDTLTIRKKTPSPTLTPEQEEATIMVSPESIEESAPTVVAPRVAPPPPPAPAPARKTPTFEMEMEPTPAQPPPAARRPDTFATTAIPAMGAPAPPPPKPAAPHASASSVAGELGERASTQYIPPAGLKGGARFAQAAPDDTKKHEEARRFARLLVSEIKLYNESKVDQGRKSRDIYERLKEDIDRSRQMYDERVLESVRKSSNYFYDELVRILADGDAEALGL